MGSGTYLESIDGNPKVDTQIGALSKLRRGAMTVRMLPGWQRLSSQFEDFKGNKRWIWGHGRGTKARHIRDGTSKTIIVSEVLAVDGDSRNQRFSQDIRGVWTCASMGASTYSHMTAPDSKTRDVINGCDEQIPADSPLNCKQVPAGKSRVVGETVAAARSQHNGGVVAARADGSVGFYTNDIDLRVWHALSTRAAGDQ
jgi:hypothetical protein